MLTDLFSWGGKRPSEASDVTHPSSAKANDVVISSKAFPKFLNVLSNQPTPAAVVDFGPVIGANVAFLGERLGCKLFIEDLTSELTRHLKAGTTDALPDAVQLRLRQGQASVDGILVWDFFDFLKKPAAYVVAKHLVGMLRPGGAIMGYFAISNVEKSNFTKFEIVDDHSLRHRPHPGAGSRIAHPNRDIIRMFEGLAVAESFLLKNNTREMLLRKR
jgi:hypothetical protein